jgi:hypothetical protein
MIFGDVLAVQLKDMLGGKAVAMKFTPETLELLTVTEAVDGEKV